MQTQLLTFQNVAGVFHESCERVKRRLVVSQVDRPVEVAAREPVKVLARIDTQVHLLHQHRRLGEHIVNSWEGEYILIFLEGGYIVNSFESEHIANSLEGEHIVNSLEHEYTVKF